LLYIQRRDLGDRSLKLLVKRALVLVRLGGVELVLDGDQAGEGGGDHGHDLGLSAGGGAGRDGAE
jgi:hypothetical protein